MIQQYSTTLGSIAEELQLKIYYAPKEYASIEVRNDDVNRPGLQLIGYYDYFDNTRVQIFGMVEMSFLETLSIEARYKAYEDFFKQQPVALIVAKNLAPHPECLTLAERYQVPLFGNGEETCALMSMLIAYLKVQIAPRITRHGVLVEVYGEGILLLGDSGVGKSETAIELVKRGHRLIADDAVEIKKVSSKSLVGSAPEIIRHFMELRGIGVVDIRRIFGMGAIKDTEKIDMVINLEQWNDKKMYDRLGLDMEYTTILDIPVPSLTVPVKPGRNLAIIIEVAAMNNRHKRMGFNAAQELTDRISKQYE